MRRAIGIDPGTLSFDISGLEGDQLFLDTTIPSEEVAANPDILVEVLQAAAPVDMIVGPPGYGLPLVKAQNLEPYQLDLLVLSEERDQGKDAIVGGMRRMLQVLKESGLPIFVAPAVIHLPTVPAHRKVNRKNLVALAGTDIHCSIAWEAFLEDLKKCVAAATSVNSSSLEILISGRLCRIREIVHQVTHRLSALLRCTE